jgi:N-methylhydantoinase A
MYDAPSSPSLRVAVDIGGTFTDVVAYDEAGNLLSFGKSLSTPEDLVRGIQDACDVAGAKFSSAHLFLHGSTVVINTLIERTGAATALVTTKGFRDIYEIGRINRPDAYNLFFRKHEPLVSRELRFEINERLFADGSVHTALDDDEVRALAGTLRERRIEAVAILLLHSYRNPDHERRVKSILQEELPGVFISASHELSQEYREFERTSTVVANAYVGPRVSEYLGKLERHLESRGFPGDFYAVQSTGGLFPASEARRHCVRILESGPAAGLVGTKAICQRLGLNDAIAFDMGGTTAKAGLISSGEPLTATHALIGGYNQALPIQVPMIDIVEVGTGGGSITRLINGGLRVGPQSAGSSPGPACYGRGGADPTVTDANLLLGRLDANQFLGGAMKLDIAAAERVMRENVADPLGLSIEEASLGIIRIAATAMSYAVKGVTTERGLDAGSFTLVTYGGAGPLHVSAIARRLGISRVIIPSSPGHFSAYGMLFGDLRYDYVRSCFLPLDDGAFDRLKALFEEMKDQGLMALKVSVVAPIRIGVTCYADMRYVGQEHAVTVELPEHTIEARDADAIKRAFDAVHFKRYGTCAPDEKVDIVSVRTTVMGAMRAPPVEPLRRAGAECQSGALRCTKPVYFSGGTRRTPVYRRDALLAGNRIVGPALIEEAASTTVLAPADTLTVGAFGDLEISIGAQQ